MSLFTSLLPAFVPARGRTLPGSCNGRGSTELDRPARRPAYHVDENTDAFVLAVQLPGVSRDGVSITAEDGTLSIEAKRAWRQPEGWTALHVESGDTGFALSLNYDEAVDADKISAAFTDGVLRLTLPKSEARKPRKIAVN